MSGGYLTSSFSGLREGTKKKALLLGGLCVAAFIVGYALVAIAFTSTNGLSEVTLVPDVRGLTVEEATRRLESAGMPVVVSDSFPNADAAGGSVLTQSPLPGQEVSAGTEVSVIISSGDPREVVPEVIGMPFSEAARLVETAGFTMEIQEAVAAGPIGTVVGTIPAPGEAAQLSVPLTVRVSISPAFWAMPNLVGMGDDEAVRAIEALGMKIAEVRYENTTRVPPYQVWAQQPLAGDSVDASSYVRVLISQPDVTDVALPVPDGGEPFTGAPDGVQLLGEPSAATVPAGN